MYCKNVCLLQNNEKGACNALSATPLSKNKTAVRWFVHP